jgi:hypothetical protein
MCTIFQKCLPYFFSGKLEEVPSFLSAASSRDKRSGAHAGYRFCQGLYAQYTNDIGKVRQLPFAKFSIVQVICEEYLLGNI